jgi:hypothetical protein
MNFMSESDVDLDRPYFLLIRLEFVLHIVASLWFKEHKRL